MSYDNLVNNALVSQYHWIIYYVFVSLHTEWHSGNLMLTLVDSAFRT